MSKSTTRTSLVQFTVMLLFFTLANTAFGQSRGGGVSRFSAGLIVAAGQGQMGNDIDVKNRTMIYTPITGFLGVNFKKLRLGASYEMNIVGQSEDPANVGNQNLSGKGSAMGIRLEYYDGKQAFGGTYRLSDTFKLDKATVTGGSVEYKSKGGFQVQYYRQIKKRFGLVLDYTSETYDESLTNNIKWDRVSLGIVLTNFNMSGK